MKKAIAILLSFSIFAAVLTGCSTGSNKPAEDVDEEIEEESETTTEATTTETTIKATPTPEPTSTPTPTPTPEPAYATITIDDTDYEISIASVELNDDVIAVTVNGLDFEGKWRYVHAYFVIDGEAYNFLTITGSSECIIFSSQHGYDKLPDQFCIYSGDINDALVYDVASGKFI
ncbi:MAG: hypothetical protein K6E12_03760 [Saccharofermentans sp.]|nr:hypothetical protein [Saccharofermentans sp.]